METIIFAVVTAVIGIGAGYALGARRAKATLLIEQQEEGQSALITASNDAKELLKNADVEKSKS